MKLSKGQSLVAISLAVFFLVILAGVWLAAPKQSDLDNIVNTTAAECKKLDINLSVGNKRTTGFLIKTFRFEDVVAEFNPVRLCFSSINATPSLKMYRKGVTDGKISLKNVTIELPFFGAINLGNGKAHLFVDKDDNIYISNFLFKGLCSVTGYVNIVKTQNLLDYNFTFAPSKDQEAFFLALMTFGAPIKRTSDGHFVLACKSKLQSISPVDTGKK